MNLLAFGVKMCNEMKTESTQQDTNIKIGHNSGYRLHNLVVSDSGISFKGDVFRQMSGPIVYVFLQDGWPLYVGRSVNGLGRPSQRTHAQAGKARALCDEVCVFACRSNQASKQLEALMIDKLHPPYNKRGKWHSMAAALRINRFIPSRA